MEATREQNEKKKGMTVGGSRQRGGGGKTNVVDGERRGEAGREGKGRMGRGVIMKAGR